MGCGLRGVGCGVWVAGCGVWGVGCGVCGVGYAHKHLPYNIPKPTPGHNQ